ncbi:MAG: nucleotidyl transferase AbiEii/AbiGii toxin family protein [Candidatus Dadabacteria bacterium]|nr:nucleotidyl transferase AbiEii/AbiGii toxin family protein [Candidatus Dadabacteria bacterium]MYB26368.1 nucleotidyl transferase AbiEii/AbiGii toxin family protein [Candidatus Dadabacteria bacterium]
MNEAFKSLLSATERERKDVFEGASKRLNASSNNMEKDFWVCLVLDVLYNGLPEKHPKLLFKGGTSLSKAFGLIQRFSEDVDIVVYREDLGFEGERDPTVAENLSNKKRKKLFEELKSACSTYILEDMKKDLTMLVDEVAPGCRVFPDPNDQDGQTLLVGYPSMYATGEGDYVVPQVKI